MKSARRRDDECAVRRHARWRRATGACAQSAGKGSEWVAQHTNSVYEMSVHYGPENGATHAVPARPLALRARPGSLRGAPAAPSAAFAGRQRGPYAIPRVGAGNDLAHQRRVRKPERVDVNEAREIQRGVLAEVGERGRLRVWSRWRGARADDARFRRRT
jgi:hypothetical protein